MECWMSVCSTTIFWNLLSSAPSFSTILRNSSMVVAPIHWMSPLASAGFSMFAASRLPDAPPAPTIVWNSSMNRITSGLDATSFMMDLSLFSKSPRYFVPATIDPKSKEISLLSASTGGMSPVTILIAIPSTMADFPTPGSPTSIGLFFLLLPRIWMTLWISSSRPTSGSSFPSRAALVMSYPNSSSGDVCGALSSCPPSCTARMWICGSSLSVSRFFTGLSLSMESLSSMSLRSRYLNITPYSTP